MSEKNTEQFLNALKQYNKEKLSKDIWIPSMERYIKFNTLTAKHQKDIIHSTIDNPILNLVFHDKIYTIIKELCAEPDLVDLFSIFDKDAILIQLRYCFVNKTYNKKDFTANIEFIKNLKEDLTPKVETIGNITIQYKIPNLLQERKLFKDFGRVKKYTTTSNDENEIREMITDAYTLEFIKHIAHININNEYNLVIDQHGFKENNEIIEFLNQSVCDHISMFINDKRELHKGMYKIDDKTDIEISPSIFN